MENIKIIQANFLEINAKRNPEFSGKLKLKTSIKINTLEESKKTKNVLKVGYTFEIDYGDLGKVKIKGELYLLSDPKTAKILLNSKENNNYNTQEYTEITNLIIKKASVKAFELEEELNLPIHIKLPVFSIKK